MQRFFSIFTISVLLLCTVACSTNAILDDINLAIQTANAVGSAVGAVSPQDAAEISKLSGIASAGLKVIQDDYKAFESSKSQSDADKVRAVAQVISSNLANELAAARISNPDSQNKVTAWVSLVTGAINAILDALPSTGVVSARTVVLKNIPTADALKAQWDAGVCQGDSRCKGLVKAPKHHSTLGNAIGESLWNR